MNKNKQLIINMAASFAAYIVSLGISFFLSPYIVESIGVDAYGFVGLANNFISYAGLITIALNSLAGRFVTIKIYEKDMDGANRYFSSVFIANAILTAFMGLLAVFVLIYLEQFINIPDRIFWDVKLLFATLFANCLVGTVTSVFTIATFATNKLYLNSIRQIESSILRAMLTILLFVIFAPRLSYIGIVALITGVYVVAFNIYYTKKLLPDIHIRRSSFDIKAVWELLRSGVWNLIMRLGQLLMDGLDLLITNVFINATAMGVLSIVKIVPTAITGVVGMLAGIFSPNFTILYAEKKKEELLTAVKQSMKIMGIITNLPIIVLIVCGQQFFSLWQPTQDAVQLQILSVLTCSGLIVSGGVNCIFNIFTVVNKLKVNAVVACIVGVLNTFLVYVLLKTTDLGLYAVAGLSSILAIIKNLTIIIPYGAICLEEKWYAFYPAAIRPVIYTACSCVVALFLIRFLPFSGWLNLILSGVISGIVAVVIGLYIILSKNDRNYLFSKLKRG